MSNKKLRDPNDPDPRATRRERHANSGVEDPSIIKETTIQPSTLETIDLAMKTWVDEKLNISATTNSGWNKVPVSWVTEDRAYRIKNDKDSRDNQGSLILPSIAIERTSVIKDPTRKGAMPTNIPANPDERGGSIVIARRINQDKTGNFVNADSQRTVSQENRRERKNRSPVLSYSGGQMSQAPASRKVVYKTVTIPMPVYVDVGYTINLHGEYQEQMNDMLQPFIVWSGGINYFLINADGHRFEAFMESDFQHANNLANFMEEEKMYNAKLEIKVLGYLIGEGKNQRRPKIVERENAVDVKLPRERFMTQDELDWLNGELRES